MPARRQEWKVKWEVGPESPDPSGYRLTYEPNHKSLEEHIALCPEHFASEIGKGRMGRYTLKEGIEK